MCASYARGFTTCVFAYANTNKIGGIALASLAQLAEHALRKRMVMGSIPIGGCIPQACPAPAPPNEIGYTFRFAQVILAQWPC
jgi:hypothetical protein